MIERFSGGPRSFVNIEGINGGPMDGAVESAQFPPPILIIVPEPGGGRPHGCYHIVFDEDQRGYQVYTPVGPLTEAEIYEAMKGLRPLRYRWIARD